MTWPNQHRGGVFGRGGVGDGLVSNIVSRFQVVESQLPMLDNIDEISFNLLGAEMKEVLVKKSGNTREHVGAKHRDADLCDHRILLKYFSGH
ncbi:MAG: hypothetical protein JWM11_6993 [Planctomycetaceae bacterium]|nr:hypothetical protein [Planctomycetaceae bacterium]